MTKTHNQYEKKINAAMIDIDRKDGKTRRDRCKKRKDRYTKYLDLAKYCEYSNNS